MTTAEILEEILDEQEAIFNQIEPDLTPDAPHRPAAQRGEKDLPEA